MKAAAVELGARILLTRDDVGGEYDFYLASERFATEHPEAVSAILASYNEAVVWAGEHLDAYAELLEQDTGVDREVWLESLSERTFHPLEPIDAEVVESQQKAADVLAEIGQIPDTITVQDAVWTWEQVAQR